MISVWAPAAHTVEIEAGRVGEPAARYPMTAADGGWWRWVPPTDEPVDYRFVVDGGDPTPDPRSAWQPHGVHGPSRTFDTSAMSWTDADWRGPQGGAGVLGAVFYELHVGTFTAEGTLDAAVGRLDHLVALGVDVVELMPVAAFPGRWGWGYDGVGVFTVHDGYGGPPALQRFVDACHARGIGVCLDVVHNHLGPSGNYLARYGPYFTEAHTTPWGPGLNVDGPGSTEVRAFVADSVTRWLRDFHVDALRLDAVHELRDDSPRHLLAELADTVAELADDLGRPLALVAESDRNDPTTIASTRDGGHGMTGQWGDDLHHALHVALTGETGGYYADFADPGALAKTLTGAFFHDGTYSSFRGRDWGRRLPPDADGRRILAYLQTHDQVGNRAVGDRIGASVTPGQQALGAALYLTSAFTPMVFMGEEWATTAPFAFFTDFEDEVLAGLVTAGRRAEFAAHGWAAGDVPDPQDHATRDRSVLRWSELSEPEHARMLAWYAALIALRRAERALRSGDLRAVAVEQDHDARWLVMRRGDALATVVSLGAEPVTVPREAVVGASPSAGGRTATVEVVLAWDPARTEVTAGGIRLPGHGAAVVRRRGLPRMEREDGNAGEAGLRRP